MTVIAVLAEPPRLELVLPELAETGPLLEAEVADLHAVMLRDVCITVERSGGDLLIDYRAEDEFPDKFAGNHDSEAKIRSVVTGTLSGTDNMRFGPQVGSTLSTRAGNAVSHLLNEGEGVHSVAVVRPTAPLLGRTHLDSAVMKLWSMPVVLGPSTGGRVYFSGFLDPIGFTDAYAEPRVETFTHRTDDASHGLDYIPMLPTLETGTGLATVVPMLRSQAESERLVPKHTMTFVFREGLRARSADGMLELVHD